MVTDERPALTPFEDYVPRLFTASDLAEMPNELESGTVHFELDDGVLISLPLLDFAYGFALASLAGSIGKCNVDEEHGIACCGGTGIILRRNPDRVVGADVAFISIERLPVKLSKEGYLETIPDLVVEVVSKNDTRKYTDRKVNDYLKAGVRIVWVVDPAKRQLV